MANADLTADEIRQAQRNLRRRKLLAVLFVVPLLLFVFVTFAAPIGTMLYRSFYHPTVAELIPDTLEALDDWSADSGELPPMAALNTFSLELKRLANERLSGKLAEEINRALPGASSLIKSTARRLRRVDDSELQSSGAQRLFDARDDWQQIDIWQAIKKSGAVIKPIST